MKLRRPFHPLLFAAYPVLSLYAANTALFPAADLARPLAAMLAATLLLWAILGAILRDAARAAAGASVAAIGFFSYGPICDFVGNPNYGRRVTDQWTLSIWALIWLVLIVAVCWKWRRTANLTQGMNIAGAVLVAIPAFTIGLAWAKGSQVPAAAIQGVRYDGPRPDLFYIILDGYGRSDVLRHDVGLDNSEFIDGLRRRGFYVADKSHSNYCQTELSITSSLNMSYLPGLIPGLSPDQKDRGVLDSRIDQSRLSLQMRALGYGYISVVTGFPAIHPHSADLIISPTSGGSLFESALWDRTPLPVSGITESQYESRRKGLISALQTVGDLGKPASRPRFVFAHILAPHPPFVLGPNGESVRPKGGFAIVDGSHFFQHGGTPEEYAKGYAGQAQAIGRLVLKAIDDLLRNARVPPIIVIQGDHGPKLHLDQERLDKTDVNEVFPILNAYYVPPKIREKLYPTITPVNTFRTILREQFGQSLPNLADRSFYSSWTWPFRFNEVTERLK
ncbi:hypothetical protein [Fimbriimonas ginsengisoli]|uniref:Putative Sulfatase n=1 Tax=Fimbriimonas ginsengisoli Gsoil 348 TaxID=661478 RepID=A0A068NKM6_FIMGI|nr:hypothetical protein [Fimbriimonas ginsengisoli]AIE83987.1 putative Sulfatase [Fimbriimonas ginsengisoli Gsoil 348]